MESQGEPSGAWHLYSDGLRLGVGDLQAPRWASLDGKRKKVRPCPR